MTIYDVRIAHMDNPIAIDDTPSFSWKIKSDKKNTMQAAYRIQVIEENGTEVWDTGICTGDRNNFHLYAGKSLKPHMEYQVVITVEDSHGETAEAKAAFETGFLGSGWKAQWVMTPFRSKKRKPGFGKQQPAVIFKKNCILKEKPVKARLYATSHGVYEFLVNRKKADGRTLAPEHTVYEKILFYQTYDVTELLNSGENVLQMHVGDGWFLCSGTRPKMKKNDFRHAALFQLEVKYSDGSVEIMGSDDTVLAAESPVRSSDLFGGELYDARIEEAENSWKWLPCKLGNYGFSNLTGQIGEPVTAKEILTPVAIFESPKGEQIVDFGQNFAGRVRINANVPEGQAIILEHCEVLDKNGNFFNNIMSAGGVGKGCDQKDVYIAGSKVAEYEPLFTYHGFRYVKVTGMKATVDNVKGIVLSTAKRDIGTFETSNERMNRLYQNIRWSQTSNMLSIPTDCPQREKAGWTGDMLVYSKTAMLNEDCTAFFDRWLKNMTCDQDKYGIIPMVTPNVGNYPMTGKFIHLSSGVKGQGTSSGWGDASVTVPYSMYEVTGDTEVLRNQYSTMKKWVDYVIGRCKEGTPKKCTRDKELEQYIWDTGYHYGEWLIPSQNKNGMDMKNLKNIMASSSCYTAPIFGWNSVNTFGRIAAVLAEETEEESYRKDAEIYSNIADKMKEAFCKCIISPEGNMPSELMGAYALPIYFDLVPEKHKAHFACKLTELLEKNEMTMDTGFLGTPYLLDALVKIGRSDLATELLWQSKSPSWLYEVDMGGTTIWENCFGYDEQGNPGTLSFNHYAFGCVADWIFRNVAGLCTDTPGFRHLIIRPHPDSHIQFCKRSFCTEQGTVVIDWRKENEKFLMDVVIPCNTTADIILPNKQTFQVGSGTYHYEIE